MSNPEDNPSNWVDLYADSLFKKALLLVDKPDLAEDILQDTFLAAYQSFSSFEHKSSVKTWLHTILRNKVIDHLRKAMNREISTDFSENFEKDDPDFNSWGVWKDYQEKWRIWESTPQDSLENQQLRKALLQCLTKLPRIQRIIVKLRLLEGLSIEEISKELELNTSNVSVLLFRARLALRSCLDLNWFSKQ